MTTTLWILGAPDPEMAAIEALLTECGQQVGHAAVGDRRVHPGGAYLADATPVGRHIGRVVLVECDCDLGLPSGWRGEVMVVDHHRSGDPGYGRGPAEFLPASSLGQVIHLLASPQGSERGPLGQWARPTHRLACRPEPGGIHHESDRWWVGVAGSRSEGTRGTIGGIYSRWGQVPRELVLVAAADHCLGAAYAGQCPGVDPDRLTDHRAWQRAVWLWSLSRARPEARAVAEHLPDTGGHVPYLSDWITAVRAVYSATQMVLLEAPEVRLGEHTVLDTREVTLPELPEVLARTGQCALYRRRNAHDGTEKIGVIGAGDGTGPGPGPVEEFLRLARQGEVHGTTVDPESAYGDPARGFAGVLIRDWTTTGPTRRRA